MTRKPAEDEHLPVPEAKIIAEWRNRIFDFRKRMLLGHRKGSGGFEICTHNTRFFDNLVREVFDYVAQAYGGAPRLALCATGSYGRGELGPFSDIDLVFILPRDGSEDGGQFVSEIVRLLWDVGLEVSNVARTITQSLDMASSDPTVKTTFIDLRHLCGNGQLSEKLSLGFMQLVTDGVIDIMIPRMHDTVNFEPGYPLGSVTVLEPNIKGSPGALRDYNISLWTAYMRHFKRGLEELIRAEVISRREGIEIRIAVDFLLRLRNEIHFLQGAKKEILTLEIQGEAAENLGYMAAGREQAIEALLRDYYHQAAVIFRFSKDLVDRSLKVDQPPPQAKFKSLGPGLKTEGSQIYLSDKRSIVEDSTLLVRAFQVSAQKGLPLSIACRKSLRAHRYLIDDEFRESAGAAREFMTLLACDHASVALREMHDCGVLGDYLPEFGALYQLPQYDVYHRFTVDEHTLLTIHFLEELHQSDDPHLRTLTDLYRMLPDRALLKLALLIHDNGKAGGPGHLERGLRTIPLIVHRLHLEPADTKKILHLVRHHQLMNELALKRDIHDLIVLTDFIDRVGDEGHLARLYLLTYADMKAVGPGVWNPWKAALLEELYFRAKRQLLREPGETERDYYRKIREDNIRRLENRVPPESIERYFARVPEKFLTWLDPERIQRHLAILERFTEGPCAVSTYSDERVGFKEILVCSRDTRGLFSSITGVLTAQGLNILGAQVFTLTDGIVLDTFQVTPIEGHTLPESKKLVDSIRLQLTDILENRQDVRTLIKKRPRIFRPRRKRLTIPSSVVADNDLSSSHTVLEVIAQDRPGLLFEITDPIRNLDLNIYLAKINTEGSRVVDVFYLNQADGKKVTDPKLLADLLSAIRQVANLPEEEQSH